MEKKQKLCYNEIIANLQRKKVLTLQLTDCHTHTKISPDSEAELWAMCRKAQELELKAYAVTDHIELCRYYPQGYYQTNPRNEEDFFDVTLEKQNPSYSSKKCFNCGEILTDNAIFCAKCGTKIKKVCPKCNAICSIKDKFCSNCGTTL